MAARSAALAEQQQAVDQQKSTLHLREAAIVRREESILQQHAVVRSVPFCTTPPVFRLRCIPQLLLAGFY